jgi:hypothetical protein
MCPFMRAQKPLTKPRVRRLHEITSRIRRVAHPDGCPPTLPG